tara:strand:+ start:7920 stop:8180 length:261 start_codon:yes stop_codon:yes gene_type:complete
MELNGTVTISLKDYTKLIEIYPQAEKSRESLYQAAKEIEVFLSFLCSRETIDDYVGEFNRQSQHSQIIIVDDRAKIKFNEENNNKS